MCTKFLGLLLHIECFLFSSNISFLSTLISKSLSVTFNSMSFLSIPGSSIVTINSPSVSLTSVKGSLKPENENWLMFGEIAKSRLLQKSSKNLLNSFCNFSGIHSPRFWMAYRGYWGFILCAQKTKNWWKSKWIHTEKLWQSAFEFILFCKRDNGKI